METAKPKSYYGQCRKLLSKVGTKRLTEMSYMVEDAYEAVSPKNHWTSEDGKPCVLIRDTEFDSDVFFVLTTNDWTHISDKDNTPVKHVETCMPSDITFYKLKKGKTQKDYKISKWSKGFDSYEVYLDDLVKVEPKSVLIEAIAATASKFRAPKESEEATLFDEADDKDEHINAMTIRDFHSIMNSVPLSNKEWLNKLIQKTNVIRNKEN
jgi:hypothetical protein